MGKIRIAVNLAVAAAVVSLAALPVARAAAMRPNNDDYLQDGVTAIVNGGFPGAWAMDSNGATGAAGLANLNTGNPQHPTQATDPAMALRIGSLTKSFVATVVLQLVASGQLGLDDPITNYLPAGLLPNAGGVTVRQVLQHTSGLPEYWEGGTDPQLVHFVTDPSYRTRTWTPTQILGLIRSQPLNFAPGSKVEYSDTNYIVAGMIVQAVTHHSAQYEVQQRIIRPLHLARTYFPTTDSSIPFFHANGYSYAVDDSGNIVVTSLQQLAADPSRNFTNYNPSILGTMGAMISTPQDLNTFYAALLGGQLLPHNANPAKDMNVQMKQTVPLHQAGWPAGLGMGLGIWSWDLSQILPACHQTVYGHEGEAPGYDAWAFGDASGHKTIAMGVNLMIPNIQAYAATELPTYVSLWCKP